MEIVSVAVNPGSNGERNLLWLESQIERWRMTPVRCLLGILLIAMLIAGVVLLVYRTGGIQYVYAHSMYFPVVLAALLFGWRGGLLAAVAGGLALGPMMPIDVATGQMQTPLNWIYRSLLFGLIGLVVGLGAGYLTRQLHVARWLAFHEPMTGLPNRLKLEQRLLTFSSRGNAVPALILVQLNNIDMIGRNFGFPMVDEVIKAAYHRIHRKLPPGCDAYLFQSDQIAAILPDNMLRGDRELPERIANTLRTPVVVDSVAMHLEVRFGIVRGGVIEKTPMRLLQHASTAVANGRRDGREVSRFVAGESAAERQVLELLGQVRRAIENDELELHYQPKFDIRSGRLVGAEALIRWQHPERGMIPPGLFIPAMEETSLIHPVTEWVIKRAFADQTRLSGNGIDIVMALNISTRNLQSEEFESRLAGHLKAAMIDPKKIELEVTESAFMGNLEQMIGVLNRLRDLGLRIAVDDFGTGHSSLAYLHRLPLDTIKIDQSFIRELGKNERSAAVVRAAVMICRVLGYHCVAEGIEDEDAVAWLREFDGMEGQGFHYARPMPYDQFESWALERLRLQETQAAIRG